MTRREMIAAGAAGLLQAQPAAPTKFQIGCMTLPYASFPLQRALEGIAKAGCRYVGWGTTHNEGDGKRTPVMPPEASPADAKQLAARCRDIGLDPVMMFAVVYVEAPDAIQTYTQRIKQATAAGIPFIISFGATKPGSYEAWIRNLKQLGPVARAEGVTITLKQHGGNTATGQDISKIIAEVADEGVRMCYDAGNVLDYENNDPIPDIQKCWKDIRSFAIKDHRNTPRDEDCGPGFGEIDHYKLLAPVLRTGLTIPLICENIFEPLLRRPRDPDGIDRLTQRSREFLDAVVQGLQTTL